MAGLFVAQQIARAANVEIVAGELEPGAERIEIAEHFQALFGDFRKLRVLGVGQIGVGAQFGAPDAAAQLIELGEAENVGAVDDDRIRARQVETAFDDRGGEQDVVFALVESAHPLLDLARAHLTVRGDEFHLGHVFVQPVRYRVHVGNARHDDEALPAAMMFAQQRLAHHHVVPFHHIGAHRQAIDRRGLDGGEFAQTRHRHLQSARDRRGRERQHVHVGAQLLELFLVRDAEALLLVDDDETEILELGLLRQDRMRAHDDVDVALTEPLARFLGFLRGDKARETPDIEREAFEAGRKILVMLAGEQGCRRDHRDLLAVHRRDEGGAQRDFGLAETDIAADEAIHRLAAFEVRQDIGNGAVLIVGFLVLEPVEELVVRPFLDFEDRRFPQRAGGGDLHQLARDRLDALLKARASLLPRFTAQSVELDRFLARSIAAEDVDILDRDEQLVPAAIFKLDAIVLRFAHRDRFEAEIFADPVFGMDDQIADTERLQFGEEGIGIAALLLAAHQSVAENILLGQQFQLVIGEARLERDDHRGRLAFDRLA